MDDIVVKVLKLDVTAHLPEKAHEDDAGYDLFAQEGMVIPVGESRLVPTGLALALPPMTEAQIRPRSGLALKHQLTVLNSPGTIDVGYRGEIGVILINHGRQDFKIEKGMRIAQMVVSRISPVQMKQVTTLDDSSRGSDGFGSTGR